MKIVVIENDLFSYAEVQTVEAQESSAEVSYEGPLRRRRRRDFTRVPHSEHTVLSSMLLFTHLDAVISIKRVVGNDDLPLPTYESIGAAGMDVRAAITSRVLLKPGERALVPTGFTIALPSGYEAQLRPRSGLASSHGITLVNSPGTIDSDYRGEIGVALINLGSESFEITRGLRIAQMVVSPVVRVAWNETQELGSTARSTGGFGHTGQ